MLVKSLGCRRSETTPSSSEQNEKNDLNREKSKPCPKANDRISDQKNYLTPAKSKDFDAIKIFIEQNTIPADLARETPTDSEKPRLSPRTAFIDLAKICEQFNYDNNCIAHDDSNIITSPANPNDESFVVDSQATDSSVGNTQAEHI